MSTLNWTIVIAVNGAIILLGLWKARETHESVDWFLAARSLPWWMVGLSMFATAVDSGDYVAVAGEAYRHGMPYISSWWLGMTIGWLLMAWVILIPLYRCGMFTNCEYLEYRFGPGARVIAVLIQIQSRTNVLANVAFSLFLTFEVLTEWGDNTWWFVVGIAAAAAAYTATGGLKSVAVTDALQSVVMLAATVVLWWCVWSHVGGWSGLEEKLDAHVAAGQLEPDKSYAMTHIGGSVEPGTPPLLVVLGYVIVLTSYCVINHSQAMRMLAARSWWDLRMAAVLAATVTVIVMWFNVSLGMMGRAVVPDLVTTDKIFPMLVDDFVKPLGMGLIGIVVAGLLAGGISTYDSIGSSLAAVITRDVYARFLVKQADDRHYLLVSRIATFLVIAVSFVYVPFLGDGMVKVYMKLVGVAVVPLLTVYLLGVLTSVSRRSGSIGLLVGIACGLSRLVDPWLEILFGATLPAWWTSTWWGYLWSIGVTAGAMLVTTLICGRATREELAGLTYATRFDSQRAHLEAADGADWLNTSRELTPEVPDYPFPVQDGRPAWFLRPGLWTVVLAIIVILLNLVVFW